MLNIRSKNQLKLLLSIIICIKCCTQVINKCQFKTAKQRQYVHNLSHTCVIWIGLIVAEIVTVITLTAKFRSWSITCTGWQRLTNSQIAIYWFAVLSTHTGFAFVWFIVGPVLFAGVNMITVVVYTL